MVLKFILKIGVGSIFIWIVILWQFWEKFESFVVSFLSWIPWEWMQDTVAYIAAPLVGYMMIIITISILTSMFSETLLIALAKKHYPNKKAIGSVSITGSIIVTIKATLIFILLFIVLVPLLFIPLFGQVVMLYLWSILLKSPTIYDVSGRGDIRIVRDAFKQHHVVDYIAKDQFDILVFVDVVKFALAQSQAPAIRGDARMSVAPVVLRRILDERFDLQEAKNLCFDLGIDFDNLPGEGKKTREVVAYCQRHSGLDELTTSIARLRPGVF